MTNMNLGGDAGTVGIAPAQSSREFPGVLLLDKVYCAPTETSTGQPRANQPG